MNHLSGDVIEACADLVGRAGASEFEIGHIRDNCPAEEAGWYAIAKYQGARITTDEHRSPSAAALALAERLLSGATCRCRKPVSLDDKPGRCRWRLMGNRWTPSCDAPPVTVDGKRGDYAAMRQAMSQPMNRAERRKKRKGKQ